MIAFNSSGTHALQSLIELSPEKELKEMIKQQISNKDIIKAYSLDVNGTHIIQRMITNFKEEEREFLNNVILENFTKLVTDCNGICVVRKILFIFRLKNSYNPLLLIH